MMKLSIILPCYNEEKNIPELNDQLVENINKVKEGKRSFEIIYIDDDSSDLSHQIKFLPNLP